MAKLRKMLGNIEDPYILELMKLIETQSQVTLSRWAIDWIEIHHFSSFEENHRLREIKEEIKEYLNGTKKLNEVKPLLKEANTMAKECKDLLEEISVRAIAVALGIITNPANALGFTFYSVAAMIYQKEGLNETRETYDHLAHLEYQKVLESLKNVAKMNEENPVKVKWYC